MVRLVNQWTFALKTWLASGLTVLALTVHAAEKRPADERPWCDSFSPDKRDLSDTGKNSFFFLWPGYRLFLQHGKDMRVISVLPETRVVDGVRTRVIEIRETRTGKVTAVSRNYFAISATTGDVYCFGRESTTYDNGKPSSHQGTWTAGVNGARFGLMMPGRPAMGDRYYHEIVPGIALNRAEIIGLGEDFAAPGRMFEHCLRTREFSDLKDGVEEKLYAPDVGLVKDGKFVLVKIGCPLCDGISAAP